SEQRREALLIIQNVHDPAVVEAVLSRLEAESAPSMRLAVLSALGHMRSAAAIPALVRELKQESTDASFVREAALSLGMIAERVEDKEAFQPAIEPLQKRFAATPKEEVSLRAALLSAMAGVADRSFAPAFAETVESNDLRLLQPSILGLRTLGDRSKLSRIRDLTANGDPLVRLAAIGAVAELGRDAEDLQSLLTRLNPSIEPNALAREAAWRGFSSYMARRPVTERIDTAKRLRETPELAARYLNELADTLVATGGEPRDLESVRDDLAQVLVAQGKHAAAAAQLRLLFQQQVDRQADSAGTVGLRWLDAALRADPPVDVGEVISRIVTRAPSDVVRAGVVDAVTRYVDDPIIASDATRTRVVLDTLTAVPADGWPPQWATLLQKLASRAQGSKP
ncbi:MAG: HEAT repeat domain-containing protein, partial [Candidatus Binatia bacterium]